MAPWDRHTQAESTPTCALGVTTNQLYQPLGVTVLVSVAISAISMGALIMLLVYVRKLMQRLSSLASKMEAQHQATLEELRRLRAEVTFDDSASQTNTNSGCNLEGLPSGSSAGGLGSQGGLGNQGSLNGSNGGFHPGMLRGGERVTSGSQSRSGGADPPYPVYGHRGGPGGPGPSTTSGGSAGGAGGSAGLGSSGHGPQVPGLLPRRPSLGAQSTGSWLDGYSSGEDLTSEEHLDLTRRTIKRTLSNSSIASVHLALTSPGLSESVSKSDLETLNFMFGDESGGGGVGC